MLVPGSSFLGTSASNRATQREGLSVLLEIATLYRPKKTKWRSMQRPNMAWCGVVWGEGASCTSKVKRSNMVLSGSVDHAGHLTALRGRPWTKRWWNESDVGRLPKGRGGGGKKGDTHTTWVGGVSVTRQRAP